MPRPLRIEFPGAWHHVMNRGASRRDVFLDENDRLVFLDLLALYTHKTSVEVHAYCLMGNHFHLLVRSPEGNMSEMMRLLSGCYARYFNDRYGKDGGLCRGRYKSVLVDSDSYLLSVSRYIHRNPLAFWKRPLRSYAWSSYPMYLGHRRPADWVHLDETLAMVGGRARYEGMVESPLASEVDELYDRTNLPTVLGSDAFRQKLRRADGV